MAPNFKLLSELRSAYRELLGGAEHFLNQAKGNLEGKALGEVRQRLSSLRGLVNRERFRVTLIGPYTSGKSTFINAILGSEIIPPALLPNTPIYLEITYGERNEAFFEYKPEVVIGRGRQEEEAYRHWKQKEMIDCEIESDGKLMVCFKEEFQVPIIVNIKNELDKIRSYLSGKSPEDYLRVERLEIRLSKDYLRDFVLVDSPGLFSNSTTHSFNWGNIYNSDAIFYFFHSAQLGGTKDDVNFLKELILQMPKGSGDALTSLARKLTFVIPKFDTHNKTEKDAISYYRELISSIGLPVDDDGLSYQDLFICVSTASPLREESISRFFTRLAVMINLQAKYLREMLEMKELVHILDSSINFNDELINLPKNIYSQLKEIFEPSLDDLRKNFLTGGNSDNIYRVYLLIKKVEFHFDKQVKLMQYLKEEFRKYYLSDNLLPADKVENIVNKFILKLNIIKKNVKSEIISKLTLKFINKELSEDRFQEIIDDINDGKIDGNLNKIFISSLNNINLFDIIPTAELLVNENDAHQAAVERFCWDLYLALGQHIDRHTQVKIYKGGVLKLYSHLLPLGEIIVNRAFNH